MDLVFNAVKSHVGIDFDWTSGTVRAMLVNTLTWVPDPDHQFVQTALAAGAVEPQSNNRTTLTGKNVSIDAVNDRALWTSDTVAFSFSTIGAAFDALILYGFVADDTDSWLIGYYEQTPATSVSTVVVASSAFGWVEVT